MVYVDTSVLVALMVRERRSADVEGWYRQTRAELVSSLWCVAEFASALGIKQRTGQLNLTQALDSWQRFERLVANDLILLAPSAAPFHRAAGLALDAASGLRAGDALHLACAEHAGAKTLATLDETQARSAERLKMKLVNFL